MRRKESPAKIADQQPKQKIIQRRQEEKWCDAERYSLLYGHDQQDRDQAIERKLPPDRLLNRLLFSEHTVFEALLIYIVCYFVVYLLLNKLPDLFHQNLRHPALKRKPPGHVDKIACFEPGHILKRDGSDLFLM